MEYGRLGPPEPTSGGSSTRSLTPDPTRAPKKSRLKLLLLLAATLLAASAVAASLVALVVRNRVDDSSGASSAALHARRPSKAISYACGRTRYPTLCVNSLLDFPGAASASGKDLVHISVNMTLRKFGRALYSVAEISNLKMDPRVRSDFTTSLSIWYQFNLILPPIDMQTLLII